MNSDLTENHGDTVRLLRPPPRVITQTKGQNVWIGGLDAPDLDFELELELETEEPDYDPYNSANS